MSLQRLIALGTCSAWLFISTPLGGRQAVAHPPTAKEFEAQLADKKAKALAAMPILEAAFKNASCVEVLSLDPPSNYIPGQRHHRTRKAPFHAWREMGRTKVQEPSRADALAEALLKDFQPVDMMTDCVFNPRHAVRIHAPGNPDIDLVICYGCGEVSAFIGNQPLCDMFTGNIAKPLLDRALDEAHIPRDRPKGMTREEIEAFLRAHPESSPK